MLKHLIGILLIFTNGIDPGQRAVLEIDGGLDGE